MGRLLVLITVLLLGPHAAGAQQAPDITGHYMACFRGTDATRPACGTLTLAPTAVCDSALDGYYSVLFGALALNDANPAGRPRDEAHFTWENAPDGMVHFTRTRFVADSLLRGQAPCKVTGTSDFEAWGRAAGDSIAGAWGRYDLHAGADTLGTFVLRARR